VSPRRAQRLEGTADSEVLLALIMDRIDAGATAPGALADLVAHVRARSAAKLNLLLGDGHELYATTCGNSLFALVGAGLAEGGVLLASEPLDDHPAWLPIPDGSLAVATGTELDVSPLPPGGST
jgi:gamma-glutamyl hercynylcysteine S-oxide hydrolase